MAEIWAIILAAGESGRMKANKLLLPFRGKTMVETVIGNVLNSRIDRVMMVTGKYHDQLLPVLRTLKVDWCYNPTFERGMLSSVQCGIEHIPASAETILVFLGDQPDIPAEVPDQLIRAHHLSGKGIVLPVFRGRRGHPLLFGHKYREAIAQLDHSVGLRGLLHMHPDDILEMETEMPGILRDVDTIEDYQKLTQSK